MALSNIFREPRREITESAVGLGVFGVLLCADYAFAQWFVSLFPPDPKMPSAAAVALSMIFIGPLTFLGSLLVLFLTHEIGDGICNRLQARGIHLRPKQRR